MLNFSLLLQKKSFKNSLKNKSDDMSSYVILIMFFSHFQLVFIHNRGVLEQLTMIFGTFVTIPY